VVSLEDDRLSVNGHAARYTVRDAAALRGLLAETSRQHPLVLREAGLSAPHDILILPGRLARRSIPSVVVPAGMYFMMGDNRDNSADSRFFGLVSREQLIGRAERILVSAATLDHWQPRLSRFWAALQ